MKSLFTLVFKKIILECSSRCPTCGETCVGMGTHPGGQHGCVNGHSW